jgi:hypothetical protein
MTTAFGILGLATLAPPAGAHFKLIEPASWIEEDERGDPQKMAPCGGTLADGGTRTGAVTEVAGGSRLKIVVNETIYHPGHYRIALARRLNWLPADPIATMKDTERGPRSASGEIEENPRPPVLVDGLWVHHEEFTGMRETEIDVPNVDCENCFLQIIQFMEDHPGFREGGFSYHHCAVVTITADPDKPPADGW